MIHEALIIVDMQNDFCPGGSLAVAEGEAIIPTVQDWIHRFHETNQLIITTQDAHPDHHISFIDQGGEWPPHCVLGTAGYALHPDLRFPSDTAHFYKGFDPGKDAYSGFEGRYVDPHSEKITSTSLYTFLSNRAIEKVFVLGLATDYCVRATVLDALRLGFKTHVVKAGIRGVNRRPHDSENALTEMRNHGAEIL